MKKLNFVIPHLEKSEGGLLNHYPSKFRTT